MSTELRPVYIALLHHPIVNRHGEVVTTAVTNLDIHDLARSARSYAAAGYVVVTPITAQRELVSRIVGHWRSGEGARHHPVRGAAFELVEVAASLADACEVLEERHGQRPWLIGTSARPSGDSTFASVRADLATPSERPALILFGTGWGLHDVVMGECDVILPPIEANAGRDGYNHLSVRSAVAIVLDRLLGAR